MRNRLRTSVVVALVLLGGWVPSMSFAGTRVLNVQGKLTDDQGNPLTGTHTIIFRLYNSTNTSIAACVWGESQNISIQSGLLNAAIGNGATLPTCSGGYTSLDQIPFTTPYYLGIQVDSDNELTPRQLLGASAYALGSSGNFNVQGNLIVQSNLISSGTISAAQGVVGTTAGDDAPPGSVGESIRALTPYGPNMVTLTSNFFSNVASIDLSPGDWDVTGLVMFYATGVTTAAQLMLSTEHFTNTDYVWGDNLIEITPPGTVNGNFQTGVIPSWRVSTSTGKTIWLKALATVNTGSTKAWGRITARRVR